MEAACAGLYVVSTRVGGVPEVLPLGSLESDEPSRVAHDDPRNESMIMFAAPDEDGRFFFDRYILPLTVSCYRFDPSNLSWHTIHPVRCTLPTKGP